MHILEMVLKLVNKDSVLICTSIKPYPMSLSVFNNTFSPSHPPPSDTKFDLCFIDSDNIGSEWTNSAAGRAETVVLKGIYNSSKWHEDIIKLGAMKEYKRFNFIENTSDHAGFLVTVYTTNPSVIEKFAPEHRPTR